MSARKIEQACHENIMFMALGCGKAPDHSTFARFISGIENQISAIFSRILLICREEGLLGGTELALAGCKISSNASNGMSGTFKQLNTKRDHLETKTKNCPMNTNRLILTMMRKIGL